MKQQASLIDYYSFCTPDCEGGQHTGEWKVCDRCGSSIHVRVFEVEHPQYGSISVGSECFKDVMGYNFTKTHEKAIETRAVLADWALRFRQALESAPRRPRGDLVALGLGKAETGVKRLSVRLIFEGADGVVRTDTSHNFWSMIRPPVVPHGWSPSVVRAGTDLGLWEPVDGGRFVMSVVEEPVGNPYPPPAPERIFVANPRRRKPTVELPLGEYEDMRVRLGLVRDPHWRGPTKPIGSSEDIYAAVKTLGVEPVEAMYVILLDVRHRVIGIHEAARGGGRTLAVEPAALLQAAVATGAQAVILVHNHPSGNSEPSLDDKWLTEKMADACKLLGIRLLDHLVIGADGYASLADRGMM